MKDQLAQFGVDRQQFENPDPAAITGAAAFLTAATAIIGTLNQCHAHGFELFANGSRDFCFRFAFSADAPQQPLRQHSLER